MTSLLLPRTIARVLAAAALLVSAAQPAAAAEWPLFVAREIGLPQAFQPMDFNARGEMAGYKLLDVQARWGRERLGWRWLEGQDPLVVRDLPQGDRHGALLAIDHSGLAVGYGTVAGRPDRGVHHFGAPNGARALVVTPAGDVLSLASLLPEGLDSIAFGVNRHHQVLGQVYRWDGVRHTSLPFLWSAEAGVQYPFGLHGRETVFAATINDHGQLAGDATNGGWVWDPEKGLLEVGMPIAGVRAMNNRGVVVGSELADKAYVWQRSTGRQFLPTLQPRDKHRCEAADVNDEGWIVGVCRERPMLWIPDGAGGYAAADLRDLVVREKGPRGDPYAWSEAVKIGEDGRILIHRWQRGPFNPRGTPVVSLMLVPVPQAPPAEAAATR